MSIHLPLDTACPLSKEAKKKCTLLIFVVFSVFGWIKCTNEAEGSITTETVSLENVNKNHMSNVGRKSSKLNQFFSLRRVQAKAVQYRAQFEIRGVLEPIQQTRAAFMIGGRLKDVLVKRGDFVERGDILARLEADEVGAGIAQARAAVMAAESQLEIVTDAVKRIEHLSQRKAIAEAELVKVRLQRDAAQAVVFQARAGLKMARVKGNQHVLRSPFAGTVLSVPNAVGAIIGPGIPQFEIADLSQLKLSGTLSSDAVGLIREGQDMSLRLRNGDTITGKLGYVSPVLSADTHRLPIEIEVDNPPVKEGHGVANSYVLAVIESIESTVLSEIPTTTLVREDDVSVFIVQKNGRKIHRRPIHVVKNLGEMSLVSGIEPGVEVIDLPPVDLQDGMQIER